MTLKWGNKDKPVVVLLRDIKLRNDESGEYIGTEEYCTGSPLDYAGFWENYILIDDNGNRVRPILKLESVYIDSGYGIHKSVSDEIMKKLKDISQNRGKFSKQG